MFDKSIESMGAGGFLRADDGDFLEGRAGVDLRAGRVGHTPRQIGLDLRAERSFGKCQAGTTGREGAFEAVLADVGVDVDEPLFRQKTVFANGAPFLAGFAAVIRDAAFLVGNDDF